ncbi:LADA_0B07426g1_1 [Lachancea dasiensis]|uniref:Kinase n=1 Tax=Lachancea dasiensis TaxID=1072105 RepID=A0A1G4ITV2_9SACH|nr:LADA_0B07426g1_1 [Lachancea dasiensis]
MKPSTSDEKQDDLLALTKHLKDVNVFDQRKLPSVIHGRKASTYLRVFQDDENGPSVETAEGSIPLDTATSHPARNVLPHHSQHQDQRHQHQHHHHGWRVNVFDKKPEKRIALPRRHSSSVYDSVSRFRHGFLRDKLTNPACGRKNIMLSRRGPGTNSTYRVFPPNVNEAGHSPQREKQQMAQGIKGPGRKAKPPAESPRSADEIDKGLEKKDQEQLLRLKPISSATYYPHQSKIENIEVVGRVVEPPLACSAPTLPLSATTVQRQAVISENVTLEQTRHKQEAAEMQHNDHDEDNGGDDSGDEVYPLAVELQPFTNKVGGHTAIFRFSERAVCKALVKRENMWYENIEQQHQELLDFIPRYIGVLNVRQHFNSEEEFQKEVEREKNAKLAKKQQKLDSISNSSKKPHDIMHSSPTPEFKNPEVVLDDNKHIIPDSLWYKYSHSPESAPSDSYLSSHSLEHKGSEFRHSGSTVVNTKLQELILREVFAPTKRKPHPRVSSLNEKLGSKGSASSSSLVALNSNVRRNSEESKRIGLIPPSSPLLTHADKAHLTNAIDSHSSTLDLKQFHLRKLAQNAGTRSYADGEGSTLGDTLHKSNSLRSELSDTVVEEEEEEGRDGEGEGEEEIFAMEEDLSPTKDTSNHESVSFEEKSHTIVSKFILLEDLTRKLDKPCVLDLKMGTRQYGVDAHKVKQLSQSKKCRQTTSRKLGVRICGLKIWNQDYYVKRDKYFGRRVHIGWQFARVLARFLYDGKHISSILRQVPQLINQLDTLYAEVLKLKGYRLYGSSLLFIYDGDNVNRKRCNVRVNLIDFAQCVTRDDVSMRYETFRIAPEKPEAEDRGFLRGVKSLKFYIQNVWNYLTNNSPLLYDDALLAYIDRNSESFNKSWDWLDDFDKESELEFDDPESALRKKWRKYELIFDVEPRYMDDAEVSE